LESTTEGEPSEWDAYGCAPDLEYKGPEQLYYYDAPCNGNLTVTLSPQGGNDLDLFRLSDCDPTSCADLSAGAFDETLTFRVKLNTRYYLVVEGYLSDFGPYALTTQCACDVCVDQDRDGHPAYNEDTCPDGDDCNDDVGSVYPGAPELTCDGEDSDCNGQDPCDHQICLDQDEDGYYGYQEQTCPQGTDCNDHNNGYHPGADEVLRRTGPGLRRRGLLPGFGPPVRHLQRDVPELPRGLHVLQLPGVHGGLLRVVLHEGLRGRPPLPDRLLLSGHGRGRAVLAGAGRDLPGRHAHGA